MKKEGSILDRINWSDFAATKKSAPASGQVAWREDIRGLSVAEKAALFMKDMTNGDLTEARKANLVIGDFTNAGALPPKAADQFIVAAVLESELLKNISTDTFDVPSFNVPWSQFAGQILYAGTQGQAVPQGQRSKPAFGQSTLTFKEFRGQVRIDDGVFENQIERSGLLNTIMGQLNIGVGRDIENAAINADTAGSGNSLFTQFDGFLKKITSYVVTGSGTTLDKTYLKRLFKRLPQQYRRELNKLMFMTATDAVVDYVDTLANRIGDKADSRLTEGETAPKWNTVPVKAIPLFPTDQGGTTDRTSVVLGDPKNMWVGFQRVVKIEQWRDPDAMQTVFNVSTKFDVTLAFEPAMAKLTDVLITTAS